MLFRSFFSPFLIFITLFLWGNAFSAPLQILDENRILSAHQNRYLENLAQELAKKTGFSLQVVLLDDSRGKREFLPDDNELLLYTAFRQQQHYVKLGKKLESSLSKATIEVFQQEFLFPEYKSARYDKGTLLLAYHLAKKLVESRGHTLAIEPPEAGPEGALNAAGWIFVGIVFSLLFFTLYKRGRHMKADATNSRFLYGRFGKRLSL